jgi:hypothetical protein
MYRFSAWLWILMFPLPICPLAGQSILGQNMSLGFMGLLSVGAKSLPVNLIFVKIYSKPRLSGAVPNSIVEALSNIDRRFFTPEPFPRRGRPEIDVSTTF